MPVLFYNKTIELIKTLSEKVQDIVTPAILRNAYFSHVRIL